MVSHFFAYLARMKYIQRWGLMRSTLNENIQEHSLQTAMIAHGLAVIKNKYFGGQIDTERVMALAVYHDISEVITGDLATPIKYFNPEIKKAYDGIEDVANNKLCRMLPSEMQSEYRSLLFAEEDHDPQAQENRKLVKAADKLCAYLKCLEEIKAGNQEFSQAERSIRRELTAYAMPEIEFFMQHFVPSFNLTLDELS